MKLVLIIYIVFLFVSIEDLFMEILTVALMSLFVGSAVPVTKVHQDCLKADEASCKVDKKINPFHDLN